MTHDEWIDLSGGGWVHAVHGKPIEMRLDTSHRDPRKTQTFLQQAELLFGQWLAWDGRWRIESTGTMIRAIHPTPKQPSHRIRFHGDDGEERVWLVLVDENVEEPGYAWSWTHEEWDLDAHEDGGQWKRVDGMWTHRDKTMPGNAPGVLVVEPVEGRRT